MSNILAVKTLAPELADQWFGNESQLRYQLFPNGPSATMVISTVAAIISISSEKGF